MFSGKSLHDTVLMCKDLPKYTKVPTYKVKILQNMLITKNYTPT
jgi:hypothetical protein